MGSGTEGPLSSFAEIIIISNYLAPRAVGALAATSHSCRGFAQRSSGRRSNDPVGCPQLDGHETRTVGACGAMLRSAPMWRLWLAGSILALSACGESQAIELASTRRAAIIG